MTKKQKQSKAAVPRKDQETSSGSAAGRKRPPAPSAVTSFPPHVVDACKPPRYGSPSPNVIALYEGAVYISRNFLTSAECRTWTQCAESAIGFESVCHPATRYIANRECGRIQLDDIAVADALYERMKPIIDEVAAKVGVTHFDSAYRPVGLNHNIRLYKYEKGMSFGRHFDGSNEISRYENGNTEITVLIYLSSCTGGATRFYPPESSSGKTKRKKQANSRSGSDDERGGIAYTPEEGAVLLHVHGDRCLEHEADPVIDGIKYILRTDVVYGTSTLSE